MSSKAVSPKKLSLLINTLKKAHKRIVFTNGCFDLLHPGHIKLFKEAKKHGDVLIVGLNSDGSIKRIKGPLRPILDQKARTDLLSGIEYIDYITVFNEREPLALIKKIKPDALVKGGDWQQHSIVGAEFIKKYGGKVIRVQLKKGHSTTSIIARIKKL